MQVWARGTHGTYGAQGGSRVGRAPHRGDLPRGASTMTETTTNIPTPTTPHDPAPRDEISRSGHPNPLTLIYQKLIENRALVWTKTIKKIASYNNYSLNRLLGKISNKCHKIQKKIKSEQLKKSYEKYPNKTHLKFFGARAAPPCPPQNFMIIFKINFIIS